MTNFSERYGVLFDQAEKKAEELVEKMKNKPDIDSINESYFSFWRNIVENEIYAVYLDTPCKSKEDIFRIAGMAYSWMPTMLDLYYDKDYDWETLLEQINDFQNGLVIDREELVKKLSKLVNHSIVGASKTLHIINPKLVPIVDSRVARGWNTFFKDDETIEKLPNDWSWNSEKEHNKRIEKYLYYWNYLLEWQKALHNKVSLRDLEILFFLLGG